jgi:hypothetical protein
MAGVAVTDSESANVIATLARIFCFFIIHPAEYMFVTEQLFATPDYPTKNIIYMKQITTFYQK